ncbi:MAG: SEC-C domain-containing protein [Acidobacteriota bacterium]
MPVATGQHKWLWRLLAALGLYVLLLPLWWYSLGATANLSGTLANVAYRIFDSRTTIQPQGREIKMTVMATPESGYGGASHSSMMRVDTVNYGLPMLIALILVTSADSWRVKLPALGLGVFIMFLLTTLAVMLSAKITGLELEDKIAQANFVQSRNPSGFFNLAFHGYSFSQPVVAVLIWLGLVMLGFFKEKIKAQVEAHKITVARNAPCPCGSGRKYKRCCGRS